LAKIVCFQSFTNLPENPLLVDLTVEEGSRLKVVYGSNLGFHSIDLDSSVVSDIYIPSRVSAFSCAVSLGHCKIIDC